MTDQSQSQLSGSRAVRLEFDQDAVAMVGGRTIARSLPVWLRVQPISAFPSRRRVRVRYRSSFFDDPVRPLIRFETAGGRSVVHPMNGAVPGSGEWTGRIPDKTVAVSISPVACLGPFDFVIDSVEADSFWQSLRKSAKLWDSRRTNIRPTITPMQDYHGWHSWLARPIDLVGIDHPRTDWQSTPFFFLVLSLGKAGVDDLQATVESLKGQAYVRWRLYTLFDHADPEIINEYRRLRRDEPRLLEIAADTPLHALPTQLKDKDCISIIEPGDMLPDSALAIAAEALASDPDLVVVYGDEDAIHRNGNLHSPAFKPDWSPIFQRGARYLGRLTCVRLGALVRSGCHNFSEFVSEEDTHLGQITELLRRELIGHIRRVLYRRRSKSNETTANIQAKPAIAIQKPDNGTREWPEVTVVVPTRDKAQLLSECVSGLKEKTDYPHYQTVIMNNGSTELDALALLDELRATPRFTVVDCPGPFNFSALSNEGASITATPLLVFLNNDISMIDSNWLKPLVHWAMQPEVGVVGAKLLFPSGTIQHAGVVVGLGGIAGHFYNMEQPDLPGYLDQLLVTHEVTAVTAACVAVTRTQFEAVGGFDSDNLPVELNDIDFCLRVMERGVTNLWTPESVLVHRQFGSRRIGLNPSKTYQRERHYFLNRWQHVIRDDRYFHPGLSLYSSRPALA